MGGGDYKVRNQSQTNWATKIPRITYVILHSDLFVSFMLVSILLKPKQIL